MTILYVSLFNPICGGVLKIQAFNALPAYVILETNFLGPKTIKIIGFAASEITKKGWNQDGISNLLSRSIHEATLDVLLLFLN